MLARNPSSPISCARACTVASEVFTEAQSFADCKLHIRTRLLAPAFSNFWKNPTLILFYFIFFPVMVHYMSALEGHGSGCYVGKSCVNIMRFGTNYE